MVERGIPESKISVVEMAVDTVTFSPESVASEEAKPLGLPESKDNFIVLYAGAFALTYDFDALLKAAKMLKSEDILFILLGDGDAKNEIMQTIKQLGLQNVIMAPPVAGAEKVARCINYSDICVMPLKPEMLTSTITRPSKVFEFWACGKPVVACTKGEMEYLTNESGAGIIVEPGDVEGLSEAIKNLYQNPEKTSEMGKKAREYVERHFSYESLRTSLINTLNNIK
ncbi:MAG: glycosyltransferase family 4 protein [Planctomycetes bacterium]|nr:glycosyltransferase family 4 protein [Planctomycetota bacterium]